MEIKTKFNVWDEVYRLNSRNKIEQITIASINIEVKEASSLYGVVQTRTKLSYKINGWLAIDEDSIYSSPEELTESLLSDFVIDNEDKYSTM